MCATGSDSAKLTENVDVRKALAEPVAHGSSGQLLNKPGVWLGHAFKSAFYFVGSTATWQWLANLKDVSGKSLRAWTPRLSRRSKAAAAISRATSSWF
jgi:hypothetical protein